VAGTWILVSWLVILVALRVRAGQIRDVFRVTFTQMWGALLVAPIIFGLRRRVQLLRHGEHDGAWLRPDRARRS